MPELMASVTAFDRWHIHKHSKDALPLWYSASLVSYLALVYAAFSEDNKLCTLNHLHLIFILSNVFRYMELISFQKRNIIGFRIIAEEYVTSILPKLGAGAMAVWNHDYTLHQTPFLDIIYFNHLILIFLESIRRNISLNFNKNCSLMIIVEEDVTLILTKIGAGAMAVWNHDYTLHQTPFQLYICIK